MIALLRNSGEKTIKKWTLNGTDFHCSMEFQNLLFSFEYLPIAPINFILTELMYELQSIRKTKALLEIVTKSQRIINPINLNFVINMEPVNVPKLDLRILIV